MGFDWRLYPSYDYYQLVGQAPTTLTRVDRKTRAMPIRLPRQLF
jgi:hypothetical protein